MPREGTGYCVQATDFFQQGDIMPREINNLHQVMAPNQFKRLAKENGWSEDMGLHYNSAAVNGSIYFASMPNLKPYIEDYDYFGDPVYMWQQPLNAVFAGTHPVNMIPPRDMPLWYFMDHDCSNPSLALWTKTFEVVINKKVKKMPLFVAKRDIEPGEWLTYNYAHHPASWCSKEACAAAFEDTSVLPNFHDLLHLPLVDFDAIGQEIAAGDWDSLFSD